MQSKPPTWQFNKWRQEKFEVGINFAVRRLVDGGEGQAVVAKDDDQPRETQVHQTPELKQKMKILLYKHCKKTDVWKLDVQNFASLNHMMYI